jgi:hypothetical protein
MTADPRPGARLRRRPELLREGLLLLGFVLLLAVSAVSVLVPELGKDPDAEPATAASDAGTR